MSNIFIIGNALSEISVRKREGFSDGQSEISFGYGGFARSTALMLKRLSRDVYFCGIFSNDQFGHSLRENCLRQGFNLKHSRISYDISTPVRINVSDSEGENKDVLTDIKLNEMIDEDFIDRIALDVSEDDYVFIDSDINEEVLAYAFRKLKGHIVTDVMSPSNIMKVKNRLKYINTLKLDKLGLMVLSGFEINSEEDIINGLKKACEAGVKEILCLTSRGLYASDKRGGVYYGLSFEEEMILSDSEFLLGLYAGMRSDGASLSQAGLLALGEMILKTKGISGTGRDTLTVIKEELKKTKLVFRKY